MNYEKHYMLLVETRQMLGRTKTETAPGQYESHHITPRSLGGNNQPNNLVLLTPREHFIAHWLLYKMKSGPDKAKMAYAFFKMCQRNNNQKRSIASRQYQLAKEAVSTTCVGEEHPNFGKNPFTDEYIQTLRELRSGEGIGMYGKTPWNKGLKGAMHHTVETREKMSRSAKGKQKSDEHKANLSQSLKGKPKSEDHKKKLRESYMYRPKSDEELRKMSERKKGEVQPILICPHCNKSGGYAMKRWHFDKCKEKM